MISLEPIDKLLLFEIIGRGSYGTVYRASYRGIQVAAKVLQIGGQDKATISREVGLLR